MTSHPPRSPWWNALHDQALDVLTIHGAWMSWPEIRDELWCSMVVFDDLVAAGVAEVQREPIMRNGVSAGERTYFRVRS